MASPSSIARLSDNEIDEEIMNEDLKHLGIGDDLSNMDLQEKKNLLSAIKASAETTSTSLETTPEKQDIVGTKSTSESPNSSPKISTDFPDLPKPKPTNRLPLSTKNLGKRNSLENQPSNLDRPRKQFCLPFCNDDNAPPLVIPEDCPILVNRKKKPQETYGRGYEEREREVHSLIEEYDSWMKSYSEVKALRQLKISQLTNDTLKHMTGEEEDEEKSQKTESITSHSSTKVEDDIYAFISEESYTVTSKSSEVQPETIENTPKGKSAEKKTTNKTITVEEESQNNQDDDIFKSNYTPSPESPAAWPIVTSRAKNKQRKNRGSNRNVASTTLEVDMNYDEKWNPQTGIWESGKPSTRITNRNQKTLLNKKDVKEKEIVELKVQCPICQHDFLQSRIENHAAECDGYFSEGTSNRPETRASVNEGTNLTGPGPSGQRKNKRGN